MSTRGRHHEGETLHSPATHPGVKVPQAHTAIGVGREQRLTPCGLGKGDVLQTGDLSPCALGGWGPAEQLQGLQLPVSYLCTPHVQKATGITWRARCCAFWFWSVERMVVLLHTWSRHFIATSITHTHTAPTQSVKHVPSDRPCVLVLRQSKTYQHRAY